ncbi:DivIVA domain-containing protein [Georgenia sp. 10Sc9-8]|uniref:DivIVA domain-containing protein n=1 Tax=Georgenia halotolerans TaxID=3028317 RepID=A0ABT5TT23_9MICO|nr:DivIVA domain-containing protein [Georgenia halotolerans]
MTTFPRAGRTRTGYAPEQVDDFFERARSAYEESTLPGPRRPDAVDEDDVRTVAFDLVRQGYETSAVDAALDRLEVAFVQRRRADHISAHGQEAWMEQVADRATTLYPRLLRPAGERFAPPEKGQGYDAASVDALLDRVVAYFDEGEELTAAEVRGATFPPARGDKAYAEGPVDAYLDRVVEVLVAVE